MAANTAAGSGGWGEFKGPIYTPSKPNTITITIINNRSVRLQSSKFPARGRTWIEFVVGSRLARGVFLRVLWFSSHLKNARTLISNFTRREDPHENKLKLMWLPL